MKLPSPRTYAFWLALLRIVTGIAWISHGVPKFTHDAMFMPPNGFFVSMTTSGIAHSVGPYHDFLLNSVQPHIGLFANLVRFGEVLIGCALFFGLLTRLGGFVGIVLTLNYMAVKGSLGSFSAWSSIDVAMLALSAINFVLPTGRFLGVDALLGRAPKSAPITQPLIRDPAVQAEFVDEQPLSGPTAPKDGP